MSRKLSRFLPLAFFLAAFLVRIYDLGRESFWFDESIQAMIGASSSLPELVKWVQGQVSGMPLDYLVSWLVGRVTLDEGWFRLPSVIWSSLAVVAAYFLFHRLASRQVALFAAALLVLSPFLVYYAQEARYYSSLLFFYTLETLLLLRAIDDPRPRSWLVLGVVAAIGSYFHLYTLFAFVNGFAWILFSRTQGPVPRKTYLGFLATAVGVLAVFLPGFLYFCVFTSASWQFILQEVLLAPLQGIGWLPLILSNAANLLAFLSMALGLLGVIVVISRRQYLLVALFFSFFDQLILLLALDITRHYLVASRQFIFLLPVAALFTAAGLASFAAWVSRVFSKTRTLRTAAFAPSEAIFGFFAVILLGLGILTLSYDFTTTKSNALQVSQALKADWSPGATVWVVPLHEPTVYDYYLGKRLASPQIAESMMGLAWEQLAWIPPVGPKSYLVSLGCGSFEGEIRGLGFSPVPGFTCQGSVYVLWIRYKIN